MTSVLPAILAHSDAVLVVQQQILGTRQGEHRLPGTGGDLVPGRSNEEDGLVRRGRFRCLVAYLAEISLSLVFFVSEHGRQAELEFDNTLLIKYVILDARLLSSQG